jgi:hypothetical protein
MRNDKLVVLAYDLVEKNGSLATYKMAEKAEFLKTHIRSF